MKLVDHHHCCFLLIVVEIYSKCFLLHNVILTAFVSEKKPKNKQFLFSKYFREHVFPHFKAKKEAPKLGVK